MHKQTKKTNKLNYVKFEQTQEFFEKGIQERMELFLKHIGRLDQFRAKMTQLRAV